MILGVITVPQTVFARPLTPANTRYTVYANDPGTLIGDGVNVITGNFSKDYTDLSTAGSQPLSFIRSYNAENTNSASDTASSLGAGWRHNYMFSISKSLDPVTDAAYATVTMNDGVDIIFSESQNSRGSYIFFRVTRKQGI